MPRFKSKPCSVFAENATLFCSQTYDCMIYRHGNMLVGRTGSGKTVGWRALQNAWGQLKDEGLEGWQKVWVYIMNSLALSNDEIYGCTSKVFTKALFLLSVLQSNFKHL